MRNLLIAFLFLTFIPKEALAEILVASPAPAPLPAVDCRNVEQVTLFRCVCRIDIPTASGRGVSSQPLFNNGSSTIFSASDLSGQRCEGEFRADSCRPTLVGRAVGRYACAEGTTTETGGFEIR